MSGDIKHYNRILADIELAKYAISSQGNPTNDEAMLNMAAYHTQQAVEKCLKFYLSEIYKESHEEKRFKIHDISTLCSRLEQHGHKISPKIKELSEEITGWETNSRYGSSSVGSRNTINEVIKLA